MFQKALRILFDHLPRYHHHMAASRTSESEIGPNAEYLPLIAPAGMFLLQFYDISDFVI